MKSKKERITISASVTTAEEFRAEEIYALEQRKKNVRRLASVCGIFALLILAAEICIACSVIGAQVRLIYIYFAFQSIRGAWNTFSKEKTQPSQIEDDCPVNTDAIFSRGGVSIKCMYDEKYGVDSEFYPYEQLMLCAEYPDSLYFETKHDHFILPARAFSHDAAHSVTELLRSKCGKRYAQRGQLCAADDPDNPGEFFSSGEPEKVLEYDITVPEAESSARFIQARSRTRDIIGLSAAAAFIFALPVLILIIALDRGEVSEYSAVIAILFAAAAAIMFLLLRRARRVKEAFIENRASSDADCGGKIAMYPDHAVITIAQDDHRIGYEYFSAKRQPDGSLLLTLPLAAGLFAAVPARVVQENAPFFDELKNRMSENMWEE